VTGPDARVEVVVEVPRGSRNKYEVDSDGVVRFDRRLPGSFAFPADYGFVPGTRQSP
jgi:inorganic pyrophosphatase